jgi:hypothetical protein
MIKKNGVAYSLLIILIKKDFNMRRSNTITPKAVAQSAKKPFHLILYHLINGQMVSLHKLPGNRLKDGSTSDEVPHSSD